MIDIKTHELLKIQATPKVNHLKSCLKFAYTKGYNYQHLNCKQTQQAEV